MPGATSLAVHAGRTVMLVSMLLLASALATVCPPAPTGFTLYPGHCIGQHIPTCGSPLQSGSGCTVEGCEAAAAAACQKDTR